MTLARIYTKEIMDYVYEKDGWLYWKETIGKRAKKDCLAGGLHKKSGYFYVTINHKRYLIHRILYQIYNNVILTETDVIDHINRDKTDNRKENLRLDPNSQNQCNRTVQKNNKSTGLKNIYISYYKNYEYYRIQIISPIEKYCEHFRTDKFTLEDIIEIRNKKLLEIHGEFACFD